MITLPTIKENAIGRICELLQYDAQSPMIFSSGLFLLLFIAFFAVYTILRGTTRPRILYVTAFSLYFYYKSSGIYLLLLLLVSLSDFVIGSIINSTKNKKKQRWLLTLSVCINLLLLCYFKYSGLLAEAVNGLFRGSILDFGDVFLPVGISFFIFQSMSYTIDIYRGDLQPLKRWDDYLFYLSFFPQLVAGPIVRAKDFIGQIRKPAALTREVFGGALFLIITGLFKKAVISDYISLNFVDRIFDNPLLYSGFENLMAIYGYALQIYCDFSGYSDMAIGLALLMGYHFPKNFDAPYKSASITEFWHRWHISLSSWLRDYLYISLGGNRKGRARTYLNLLITMVLGGLWHGAAVRFILWGALHGVALAAHKFMMSMFPAMKSSGKDMKLLPRIGGIMLTFNYVCLGWLLFRAENMQCVELMLHQIFHSFDLHLAPQVLSGYAPSMLLIAIGFVLHMLPSKLSDLTREWLTRRNIVAQMAILTAMIWLVMQVMSSDIQPFIYFQF